MSKQKNPTTKRPVRTTLPTRAVDINATFRSPEAVVIRLRITAVARCVAAHLADACGQNGYAWPSLETMAETLGFSERAVRTGVAQLKRVGVVHVESRRARKQSSLYTFVECEALRLVVAADPSLLKPDVIFMGITSHSCPAESAADVRQKLPPKSGRFYRSSPAKCAGPINPLKEPSNLNLSIRTYEAVASLPAPCAPSEEDEREASRFARPLQTPLRPEQRSKVPPKDEVRTVEAYFRRGIVGYETLPFDDDEASLVGEWLAEFGIDVTYKCIDHFVGEFAKAKHSDVEPVTLLAIIESTGRNAA